MEDAPVKHPQAIRAGRVLDFLGQLLFPIGLGVVVGFFAADRGVRLVPTMLSIVMVLSMVALLMIAAGRWLRGSAYVGTRQGKRLRKRVVFALLFAQLALGGWLVLWWVEAPSALTELESDAYETAFVLDAQRYREHTEGIERLVARLEAAGVPAPGHKTALSSDEEALLLRTWASLLDYAVALDQIRRFHEDYYRFDPSRAQLRFHLRSFLLTYAAELALYEKASRFTELVLANANAKKFLDSPHPDLGLPVDSFSRFRGELLGARDQARVIAGENYLDVLATAFGARTEAHRLGVDWLWRRIEGHLGAIETLGTIDRAELTVRADAQLFAREAKRVWFPIQKEAAELMGDTRVRRIGWYLIDHEQQEELDGHLEPGDILLSRKNWYLSNVGLPGFWPHAILYLGDADKLDAYFAGDAETSAWVAAQVGRDLSFGEFLKERYPQAWVDHRRNDPSGPRRVVEAVSEGVVFNTLEHAAGDYLVALRPRLSKRAKAQAISRAFSHAAKPYDFEFDFATGHALVCTELVWRSYRDDDGIDFPLTSMAGRLTLPANDIARMYAEQYATPEQQLDFVYFLDAIEKQGVAVVSDEAAFRTSHERLKWDLVQR